MHLYGDSLLIIICMNGMSSLQNYMLPPLFRNLKRSTTLFCHLSFNHVYRNMNEEANMLSKVGLVMDKGSWKVTEKTSSGTT
jgi:hypothetical protein